MKIAAYTQTLVNLQMTIQSTFIALNNTCDVAPVQKDYQKGLDLVTNTILKYYQKGINESWSNVKAAINWKFTSHDDNFACKLEKQYRATYCFCDAAELVDPNFTYGCKGVQIDKNAT